jgi:hypothetical protein
LEATASALECQADLLDAVRGMAHAIPALSSEQHARTMEAIRWLDEHMESGQHPEQRAVADR